MRRTFSACPVLGVTGTGGSGKSSLLTDELILPLSAWTATAWRASIAVLAIDPSRRKTRRRASRRPHPHERDLRATTIYMRSHRHPSVATAEVPALPCPQRGARRCRAAGFDLIIVETPGIGQGDAAYRGNRRHLSHLCDDAGVRRRSPSLKRSTCWIIADVVAYQQVRPQGRGRRPCATCRKQVQRNRESVRRLPAEKMPVYGSDRGALSTMTA